MSREILITTPENIAIEFELAGLGTRFLANFIDILLQCLLWIALLIAFFIIYGIAALASITGLANFIRDFEGVLTALWFIAGFVLTWGYMIYFELRWNGQTPGKKQLGLRVIQEGGYPVGAYGVITRNLLRVIDFPILYFVGVVSILCSKNYQRLGDMVGGTLVVKQRAPQSLEGLLRIAHITPEHLDKDALTIVAREADRMSPDEYRGVRHFTERRRQLSFAASQSAAIKIAVPLMQRLHIVPPEGAISVNYADFLEYLAVAYEQLRRPK